MVRPQQNLFKKLQLLLALQPYLAMNGPELAAYLLFEAKHRIYESTSTTLRTFPLGSGQHWRHIRLCYEDSSIPIAYVASTASTIKEHLYFPSQQCTVQSDAEGRTDPRGGDGEYNVGIHSIEAMKNCTSDLSHRSSVNSSILTAFLLF